MQKETNLLTQMRMGLGRLILMRWAIMRQREKERHWRWQTDLY